MDDGWKIESWSREKGLGTIRSEFGSLSFDAACADVDDFVVGEAVLVELENNSGTYRVKRLAPDVPRFRRLPEIEAIPDPPGSLLRSAAALLSNLRLCDFERIHSFSPDDLRVEGVRCDAVCHRLVLRETKYFELPVHWTPKLVRLATREERAYLATKFEREGEPFLAITWITEERRFHFAACGGIEFEAQTE